MAWKVAGGRVVVTAVVVACAVGLATPAAEAKPGALDPGFGAGGRVVREANLRGPWASVMVKLAALPDGGTILLADRKLYAFHADGSTDRDFGGGRVAVESPNGADFFLSDLTVDARRRVLVVGAAAGSSPDGVASPELAMVTRYTADGEIDRSFGNGGTALIDFGLPPLQSWESQIASPPTLVGAAGIAVDAAGRVVLTGSWVTRIGPCRSSTNLPYREAFVARLDPSGNLDPSFGRAGLAPLGRIAAIDPPVLDRDGSIYLSTPAGAEAPCNEPNFNRFVGHLTADGGPDADFGTDGWVQLGAGGLDTGPLPRLAGSDLVVDRRHRPLLFGESRVRRFLPNGTPDPGFGRGGVATLIGRGGELAIAGGGIDSRGRILMAGTFVPGAKPVPRAPRRRSFFLIRLDATGGLDRSFTPGFGRGSKAVAGDLLLRGGQITIAGTVKSPLLRTGEGVALARYRLRE
jgi:uncharacterized delta-60 repeat protein